VWELNLHFRRGWFILVKLQTFLICFWICCRQSPKKCYKVLVRSAFLPPLKYQRIDSAWRERSTKREWTIGRGILHVSPVVATAAENVWRAGIHSRPTLWAAEPDRPWTVLSGGV